MQNTQYAVMIKTKYARYLPEVWVTHTVCDTKEAAFLEASTLPVPYDHTCVCEYHSREWEGLVR